MYLTIRACHLYSASPEKEYYVIYNSFAIITFNGASLVAQLVKSPPAMQETPVQFWDWENPQEKRTATHSRNLT